MSIWNGIQTVVVRPLMARKTWGNSLLVRSAQSTTGAMSGCPPSSRSTNPDQYTRTRRAQYTGAKGLAFSRWGHTVDTRPHREIVSMEQDTVS